MQGLQSAIVNLDGHEALENTASSNDVRSTGSTMKLRSQARRRLRVCFIIHGYEVEIDYRTAKDFRQGRNMILMSSVTHTMVRYRTWSII